MKPNSAAPEGPKALLRESEVATLLGISPATVRTGRSRKLYKIPYVRIGGAIRYRPEDIEAYIESNRKSGVGDEC